MKTENLSLHTILLADDDSDDREFFQDALNAIALDIVLNMAENGLEALQLLQRAAKLPDLIFLDLNMPVRNGYDCLNDIKADERLKNIPVIIFSTSLQQETANEVYNGGASLYVVKPNSFPVLKSLLKKVFALDWRMPMPRSRENFIFQA